MSETVVIVQNLHKSFCRSLKKSLWYGLQDILSDLNPSNGRRTETERPAPLRSDEFRAVNDVSFELKKGECIGLIGHNGAGKTTLLKMLNGLLKPDWGTIEMRGRVGALIALGAGFNPILSGRENIYVNGAVLGLTKREITQKMDEIIDFAEIRDFIDAPVQTYSSGMAVRLGFAIAVRSQPDILLLDEVLAVGDISFQAKCFNTLSEFRRRGTAFILVSHNMHQISRYCDRVLYLKRGSVALLGSTEVGIRAFHDDMSETGSGTESTTTDWSRAYGTGKVLLKEALFLNAREERIEEVSPDEPFSLLIKYERVSEDPGPMYLDIIIRDREGVVFQGTSLDYGVLLRTSAPEGVFRVRFGGLPVNGSKVDFFFALLSHPISEVYDWKRYIPLKILPKYKLSGRLALDVEWSADVSQNHK